MRFLLVFVLFLGSTAFALEDDGRLYSDIAKRVSPAPGGFIGQFPYGSDVVGYDWIVKYLDLVDATAAKDGHKEALENSQCSAFHAKSTDDRTIDIHLALGYYDDSTPEPVVYAGLDFGKAASFDEGMAISIRRLLTSPCPNAFRKLCEFKEVPGSAGVGETVLVRNIDVQGRPVEVRVTLTYASASPFYQRNKSELRAKQERLTRQGEENFFGGFAKADYVFYVGHSRNGGGPDFNPPRLTSVGKVDYFGYYRKVFPGRDRMIRELKAASNKDVTLGMFSCDSDLHFRQRLLAANPKQNMILTLGSTGMLNYYDVAMMAMTYTEGLLRGSCGAQLESFARVTSREKAAYRLYNMK